MALEATPGQVIYPDVSWGENPGTLGVRIRRKSDLVDVVARTTSGISEAVPGSFVYVKTTGLEAPDELGPLFMVVWDNGSEFVTEDLTIVEAPATLASPSGALCTREQVKVMMNLGDDETHKDAAIDAAIIRASAVIEADSGRTLTPETDATHRFILRERGGFVSLGRHDLRAESDFTITVDGTELEADVDYFLSPIDAEHGVYTGVDFATGVGPCDAPGRDGRSVVVITGDWGFPEIPAGFTQACIVTVQSWVDRGGNELASLDTDEAHRHFADRFGGWSIPTHAKRLYRDLRGGDYS